MSQKRILISLLALTALLVVLKDVFASNINLLILGSLIIACELIFDASVALMLFASGIHRLRLKDIIKRDYSKINFRKPIIRFLWIINRVSWLILPLYVLLSAWSTLRFLTILLLITEIVLTIGIGFTVVGYLRPSNIGIRLARSSDVDRIVDVEERAWGSSNAATKEQILKRIEVFPKGNYVAEAGKEILGYVSFIFLDYHEYEEKSWYALTDNGYCTNHNPNGKDLFGITLSVPKGAPPSVSIMLLFEVMKAGIRNGVRRGILGSRLPRYHRYASTLSASEYAYKTRHSGALVDPELEFYRRKGLKVIEVIPDYYEDPQSLNYGAIVELKVPFHGRPILSNILKLLTFLPLRPIVLFRKFEKFM